MVQFLITALKECGQGKEEDDERHGVEEEKEVEQAGVGIGHDPARAGDPLDADQHDHDGDRDHGRADDREEPGQPVHPVGQAHQLHQLLHDSIVE